MGMRTYGRHVPSTVQAPPDPAASAASGVAGATGLAIALLVQDLAGYQITNAAAGAGTDIPEARTAIDFEDASIDSLRVLVRGKNSAAGSVIVQVYRVTGGLTIAAVTVTDTTLGTFIGTWTSLTVVGGDEAIGLRVVGDGAFDPVLYRVDLQMRRT